MKSPDDVFINQFGRYELSQYAFASQVIKALQAEKDTVVEEMYDDISPKMTCTDYELGVTYAVSASVEDMALNIIAVKEGYDRRMERYQDKADMFEVAMSSLSPRERDVVQVRYFNTENKLGLSGEYFAKVLREAEGKLCSYIGKAKLGELNSAQMRRKEELKRQVAEFKGHRVHVS
jgi:hypothetical protein